MLREGLPPPVSSYTRQQENLLQENLMQALMHQVQAMQVLFQHQDELQVLREIQDLIDDWADAREARLAYGRVRVTGSRKHPVI